MKIKQLRKLIREALSDESVETLYRYIKIAGIDGHIVYPDLPGFEVLTQDDMNAILVWLDMYQENSANAIQNADQLLPHTVFFDKEGNSLWIKQTYYIDHIISFMWAIINESDNVAYHEIIEMFQSAGGSFSQADELAKHLRDMAHAVEEDSYRDDYDDYRRTRRSISGILQDIFPAFPNFEDLGIDDGYDERY